MTKQKPYWLQATGGVGIDERKKETQKKAETQKINLSDPQYRNFVAEATAQDTQAYAGLRRAQGIVDTPTKTADGTMQMPDVEKLPGGGYRYGGEFLTNEQWDELQRAKQGQLTGVYTSADPQIRGILEQQQTAQKQAGITEDVIAKREMEAMTYEAQVQAGIIKPGMTEEELDEAFKKSGPTFIQEEGGVRVANATIADLQSLDQAGLLPKEQFQEDGSLYIPGHMFTIEFDKQVKAGNVPGTTLEQMRADEKRRREKTMTAINRAFIEKDPEFQVTENEDGSFNFQSFTLTKTMQQNILLKATAEGTAGAAAGAIFAGAGSFGLGAPGGAALGFAGFFIRGMVKGYFDLQTEVKTQSAGDMQEYKQHLTDKKKLLRQVTNNAAASNKPPEELIHTWKTTVDTLNEHLEEIKLKEINEWGKQMQTPHPTRAAYDNFLTDELPEMEAKFREQLRKPSGLAIYSAEFIE